MSRKQSKGRVLAVKLGSNPNSSSLGVDVSLLLGAGAAASLLCLLGGSLARWIWRGRKVKPEPLDDHEPS